jgi:hypothetical protein
VPEFTERFVELMSLLETRIRLPKPQCDHIKHYPDINPPLEPQPQDWWRNAFDWYIAVELIPFVEYGPIYALHGNWFWPQIGNPRIVDSEKKCFFGLEKPNNIEDAKTKYNLHESTLKNLNYLYEFKFNVNNCCLCCEPLMFAGPVRGGTGFQMNPNRVTCMAIRIAIVQNNVTRYRVIDGGFSEQGEVYSPWETA